MNRETAIELVTEELNRASAKFGPMLSFHDGHSVIREEFEELWEEVRKRNPDNDKLIKEAVQVAAMAIRFLVDLCEEPAYNYCDFCGSFEVCFLYGPHHLLCSACSKGR